MSARSTMTMRATVTRDVISTSTSWGGEEAPDFVEVGVIPCRAWSKMRRDVDDSGKSAVVEDMRARVPASADVEEKDQLVIHDRMGNLLFGGPVAVETKTRRGGPSSVTSHQELMLIRHTGSA